MDQIAWVVLSLVLLVLMAACMFMVRPAFFPTVERIIMAGFSVSLGLGTFFMMIQLAEFQPATAGLTVLFFLLTGWFWQEVKKNVIRFKDPGMDPRAPDE